MLRTMNNHTTEIRETKRLTLPGETGPASSPATGVSLLVSGSYEARKQYYKNRYQLNKERFAELQRDYHNRNKASIALKRRIYRESRSAEEKEYKKNYILIHKEELSRKHKEYYSKNFEKIRERARCRFLQNNEYRRTKYKTNVNFRLTITVRNRLGRFIRKGGSSVRDLGCTIPELKAHLEMQFLPGMTWANHSLRGWHIDHIIPLYHFDLSDRAQFLKACHYTNLQPLWSSDNWKKNKRLA